MSKPDAIVPIVKKERKVRGLVYADPGTGKTRLLGSSPKPTLIIRPPTDHTDSLAAVGSTAEEWVTDSWNEMEEVYDYMRHEGFKTYDWCGLDSISIWQDAGLDDVYEDMLARKRSDSERQLRAQYGPDKGEYGVNMHRLAKWVRHMCALDINFLVTAHPFMDEDPDGNPLFMPWIQGRQMPQKICGYMNLVGYMTVKENKDGKPIRVLVTDRTERFYAKDQFEAFGGKLLNPTIPKIEEKIAAATKTTGKGKRGATKRATTKRSAPKRNVDQTKTTQDSEEMAWDD